MCTTIRQIAVSVADLQTAIAFYRDKLGIKLLFEAPPGLAFFELGDIWLMLSAATETEPARPGSTLYFEVDDIHAHHLALQERGVAFIDEPHFIADMGRHELWMSFFRDPDETLLAIRAEVSKP